MKVRCVPFAFVSAAFLAATAISCGAAFANSPEANAALVRKAYATHQTGDASGAVAEYSDAIASDLLEPEMLANALLNRALAYQQLNDLKSALADYDAAVKLNVMAPALRSTALYNRGLAHQKQGDLQQAVEDFTASLLINPEFAQAFFSRANALRDSGQLLFALSDYERAIRFNHPNKARVHFGAATTYLALHRPLDAKREFNAVLNLDPDFGEARAQLVLLGDENAKLSTAAADPIMTGSVGAYSGGTNVTKPGLPAAIDVPDNLQGEMAAKPKKAKLVLAKIEDRVPATEVAAIVKPTEKAAVEMASAEVPLIDEPVTKPKAEVVADVEQPAAEQQAVVEQAAQASGWIVQVASADSESAAWSTWKKMQARYKVLKSQNPTVVKADLGSKGIYYRVRLSGFDGQGDAKKACAKLKAGGVSCYISKIGT